MKKNLSLLLTSVFVAGCGCSSGEESVYSHATGLPEGPKDTSRNTYEIDLLTYNFVKNEADFLAGNITATKYCDNYVEMFPVTYVNTLECVNDDLARYYDGVMKDNTRLSAKTQSLAGQAQAPGAAGAYVLKDLEVTVDYSEFASTPTIDPADSDLATVKLGGFKIIEKSTYEQEVAKLSLDSFFTTDDNHKINNWELASANDLAEPNSYWINRIAPREHYTYTLEKKENKWIINDIKMG